MPDTCACQSHCRGLSRFVPFVPDAVAPLSMVAAMADSPSKPSCRLFLKGTIARLPHVGTVTVVVGVDESPQTPLAKQCLINGLRLLSVQGVNPVLYDLMYRRLKRQIIEFYYQPGIEVQFICRSLMKGQ